MYEKYLKPRSRILDLDFKAEDKATFYIDEDVRSTDLLATLMYVRPSEEQVTGMLNQLLKKSVDENRVLKGIILNKRRLLLPKDPHINTKNTLIPKNPNFADIKSIYEEIYGYTAHELELGKLALRFTDKKIFVGLEIDIDVTNEFTLATESDIEEEMTAITKDFYGENDQSL